MNRCLKVSRVLLIVSVLLISVVSCRRKYEGKIYVWHIGNRTDQTLILKCPYSITRNELSYGELELKPASSIEVCDVQMDLSNWDPSLNYYFEKSAEMYGEDVSWQLLAEDGTVLKKWSYKDRNLSEQRFFDSSLWEYQNNWEWWASEHWSFYILPEDITE